MDLFVGLIVIATESNPYLSLTQLAVSLVLTSTLIGSHMLRGPVGPAPTPCIVTGALPLEGNQESTIIKEENEFNAIAPSMI